jgi:LmbE family N-acetylglucosaminyl deacetylase
MDRHRHLDIFVVHVTDGSPRDLGGAREAGFRSRRAYASARRHELHQALRLAGVDRSRLRVFSFVDKETCLHLPELIARMAELIERVRPGLVLSPCYEGGHPDHDSAALAVHVARRSVSIPFRHREYPLYHAGPDGAMLTGEFLRGLDIPVEVLSLSEAEQNRKRQMLASFTTQQHILSHFETAEECFRDAPSYDFTRPPHEGILLYEHWRLGVSGCDWRDQAAQALQECRQAQGRPLCSPGNSFQ